MADDEITVPDFAYEDTDGQMRVHAIVRNDADVNQDVTLTMQVRADEEHSEKTSDLTVRANDTAEAEAVFDLGVEAFERDGSLDFDWDADPE